MGQPKPLLQLSLLLEDELSFWQKLKYAVRWFFTDERFEPKFERFKAGESLEYESNAIFFVNAQSVIGDDRPFVCKGLVPARFLYVKASRWRWGVPVAYQLIFEELNPEKLDFGLIRRPYYIHLNFLSSCTPDDLEYAGFDLPDEADVWLSGMVALEKFRERFMEAIREL